MAIIRWNPFQELADVRREMQSLASLMPRFMPFSGEERFVPALDCTTRGDDLVCRAELPGIDVEKDVDVTVEQGVLRISGQRREQKEEEREGYQFREMRYGRFQRTLPLPENVSVEDVSADYKDGILEIVVKGGAKQVEAPPAQRISINRAQQGQQGQMEEPQAAAEGTQGWGAMSAREQPQSAAQGQAQGQQRAEGQQGQSQQQADWRAPQGDGSMARSQDQPHPEAVKESEQQQTGEPPADWRSPGG